MSLPVLAPVLGVLGLLMAFAVYRYVVAQPAGSGPMIEIADAIESGAMAFLRKEYSILVWFIVVVAVLLGFGIGSRTALAFISGAICSMLAGFIGMKAATKANVRTAQAARTLGRDKALAVAFFGGSVMGLTIAALGMLGLGLFFLRWPDPVIISGFAMGASSIALFARVGGGIYTKSADVGADLVGKVEAGIPEDDPRNPAVIADNVGDNVGDVAGMGADLFESYVGSIVAAIAIGSALPNPISMMLLPLVFVMAGFCSSAAGVLSMGFLQRMDPQAALRNATLIAAGILIVLSWVVTRVMEVGPAPFWAVLSGLLAGAAIGYFTERYTSGTRVEEIAESSKTGSATNIITGIAVGAWMVGRWRRLRRTLDAFGWAELALAITLLVSMLFYERVPYWFMRLASVLARRPEVYPLYEFVQSLICFAVMFVPTVCLGMTLPLVSRIATATSNP